MCHLYGVRVALFVRIRVYTFIAVCVLVVVSVLCGNGHLGVGAQVTLETTTAAITWLKESAWWLCGLKYNGVVKCRPLHYYPIWFLAPNIVSALPNNPSYALNKRLSCPPLPAGRPPWLPPFSRKKIKTITKSSTSTSRARAKPEQQEGGTPKTS